MEVPAMNHRHILLPAILTGALFFNGLSASAVEVEIVGVEEIPDINKPQESFVIQLPGQGEEIEIPPASPQIPSYIPGVEPGLYEISSAQNANFVLDIRHCTVHEKDFRTAQLYRSMDINQQKFSVDELPNGLFRIRAKHTGEALTAGPADDDSVEAAAEETSEAGFVITTTDEYPKADSPDNVETSESSFVVTTTDEYPAVGSAVTTAKEHPRDTDASDEQSWIIEKAPNGYCYIRTVFDQYVTLADSRPYSGDPVVLADYTGGFSQMWKFEPTEISTGHCSDTDLVNPYGDDGPYSGLRLTLQFDTQTETITAKDLSAHISENADHEFVLDPAYLDDFVARLAEEYDTPGDPVQFCTDSGEEITVHMGDTGQKLDRKETKAMLEKYLGTNQSLFLTPVWEKKAATAKASERGDFENGYVEIDLKNQKVYLYKNGRKLLESDCVSGNSGEPHCETPEGVYYVYYKASPDTLDGPGYSEEVSYWMAFYGNYGLHDATWRDEFGGEIYKGDGSHGCVNLPLEAAKLIYNTVTIGYPVVLYQ